VFQNRIRQTVGLELLNVTLHGVSLSPSIPLSRLLCAATSFSKGQHMHCSTEQSSTVSVM